MYPPEADTDLEHKVHAKECMTDGTVLIEDMKRDSYKSVMIL